MDGWVLTPPPFLSSFPFVTLVFLLGTKVLPEKQRRLRSLTLCPSERIVQIPSHTPCSRVSSLTPALRSPSCVMGVGDAVLLLAPCEVFVFRDAVIY